MFKPNTFVKPLALLAAVAGLTLISPAPLFAAPTPTPKAPSPGTVTERAVLEMRAIEFRTTTDLELIRFRGVNHIAALKAGGATADAIKAAGAAIDEHLTDRATEGLNNLAKVQTSALAKLASDGGTDAQKARINSVFSTLTGALTKAESNATTSVNNAVTKATT